MKIAIVLSGHLRSFRKTHSSFLSFKNTLQQLGKVDVFCHTWDVEESVTPSWWKQHNPEEPPPSTVNILQIEEAFHPVKIIVEPSRQFDDSTYKVDASIPVAGILSMLHSQYAAFELLKDYERLNRFQYDIVIKSRYDLLYEIADDFTVCMSDSATNNCVYLPSSNPYELIGSYSDIFAVGNRQILEKYFSFCQQFNEALDIYKREGYRQLIPEFCMTVYLKNNQVKIKELTGLRLHILRMNGEKFQINTDKNFDGNAPLCFYRDIIKKCAAIINEHSDQIQIQSRILTNKYMSWLNGSEKPGILNQYAEFYSGQWIKIVLISRLAQAGKNNPCFTPNVMKNYFEEALCNARYSTFKKFIVASVLFLFSGYSFFFFRVWKKITFN